MSALGDLFKDADFKQEKHVPVIEAPGRIAKSKDFNITAKVGKVVPHPNTTEHHIRYIELYFLPQDENSPVMVGRADFTAHGESAKGPNASTFYTQPQATFTFKTEKPGTFYAASYCNIHGLWQSSFSLEVEQEEVRA